MEGTASCLAYFLLASAQMLSSGSLVVSSLVVGSSVVSRLEAGLLKVGSAVVGATDECRVGSKFGPKVGKPEPSSARFGVRNWS